VATDRDEMDGLAAEYVLGTLDAGERLTAEARLASDPAFRAAVAAWAARLQPIADAAAPVDPPAELYERIVGRIDTPVETLAGPSNVIALRRSVRRWQFVSALAAAAAVVLAVLVVTDRPRQPEGEYVAMLTPGGGAPAFVLTVDTRSNTMSIRRVAEEAPATGRSYELWAVEPDGGPVTSLGVVDQVSLRRDLPYAPDGLVFAISDEPLGGSPTGVATGEIVFSGPLVPAD
jgi:anti-sigma-K factor RskA